MRTLALGILALLSFFILEPCAAQSNIYSVNSRVGPIDLFQQTNVVMVASTKPDQRDRDVLEALLVHLRTDSDFKIPGISSNGTTMVLHARTPEKTGFLTTVQIRSDIRNRELPGDALNDLQFRNRPAFPPGSYDSVTAYYNDLILGPGIVVANITGVYRKASHPAFREAYPDGRAWIEAYLPGFSRDGLTAVVRAGVGPSEYGAMLTAVLEKQDNRWFVKWYHIAWYA
jgi:hypothetical protein